MKPTFAANATAVGQLDQLRFALLSLSREGYLVKKYFGGPEAAIEIDRPMAGYQAEQNRKGGRIIFSVFYLGRCRVYWVVDLPVGEQA